MQHVVAGLVAGGVDGLHDHLDGLFVRGEVGREAALVADRGGQALGLEHRLEAVVDLGAHAQGLLEARGADRHDHELLQVDVVVGVLAAVHDVHHRHRQLVRVAAADVLVQRQLERRRGGVGDGQRHAEDGVGAQLGLVGRAVELDEHAVDEALVGGVEADDLLGDDVVDVVDGGAHALAHVLAALVAQLHGLVLAGGRAGGHGGAAHHARPRARPRPRRWGCRANRGSAWR